MKVSLIFCCLIALSIATSGCVEDPSTGDSDDSSQQRRDENSAPGNNGGGGENNSDDDGGGGGNNAAGPTCGSPGRTGVTMCDETLGECQAGQYCNADMLTCSVGCTSDNNCAANQFCDLTGGAPGTCAQCATPDPDNSAPNNSTDNNATDNNATDNNADPNNSTNPNNNSGSDTENVELCREAVEPYTECGILTSGEATQFAAGCNVASDAEVREVLAAINGCAAAANDCDELADCVDAFEGGDNNADPNNSTNPNNNNDGACLEDDACDTTPGVFHEVCSGGFCTLGCRSDEDCGNDYICDDFASPPQCSPF